MNKKNLFLSVPLAAGIALAGCGDEESQEDNTLMEEDTEQTDENMINENTGDPDASVDDEGSDEDNEGMLNEDPNGEGTDDSDLDTDEGEEF
ncbi:MAG: hypothetical protein ACQEUT_12485 [Bacillota bacterium]